MTSTFYLEERPVHDISIEMEGYAAHDAHLFANTQWEWIRTRRGTIQGRILSLLPDKLPFTSFSRAHILEWPLGKASPLAPSYERSIVDKYELPKERTVPVISVGRQGAMVDGVSAFFSRTQHTPGDEALVAMFGSATKTIRMSLQALGPLLAPTEAILGWPTKYFKPMVKAMWNRGVVIQIVLTNLNAPYSTSTTLEKLQSKIIKCMQEEFPEVTDEIVREKICNKLLILTRIRHKGGNTYYQEDAKISSIPNDGGNEIGNHSKFVIVDDICSYTGSNNLYRHDLAEWGVIIDDANITAKMMEDYWNPMWKASHDKYDCNVDKCMEYLKHDTDNDEGEYINPHFYSGQKKIDEIATAMMEAQN